MRLIDEAAYIKQDSTLKVLSLFSEAYGSGIPEDVLSLNTQSLLGLHYLFYVFEMNNISHMKFSNELEAFEYIRKQNNRGDAKNRKKEFFSLFDDTLYACREALLNSKDFKDNAEFFIFVRYCLAMDELDMSEEERHHYIDATLSFLVQIKNPLALEFVKK